MARTKASVGSKVSSGKSSKARCSVAPAAPSAGGSSAGGATSRSAGNAVCPRDTPAWQKPITRFFCNREGTPERRPAGAETDGQESPQKPSRLRRANVSSSDDEGKQPRNQELDDSIVLEPLQGETSRKMPEFYSRGSKGKGVGKKTNKENIDNNKARRHSGKRDLQLEEIASGDEARASKRVKVN